MSVVTSFLMGGLGNQLFQIFTTIAYGIRFGRKVVLPYSETLTTGVPRNTYWNDFLSSLKMVTTFNEHNGYSNNDLARFVQYREQGHHYSELANVQNKEISLFGYFQSPLYFEKEKETIFSMIRLSDSKNKTSNMYPQYHCVNSISMHFRLGDYKHKQDYHPILPYDYYYNSLLHIVKNTDSSKSITVLYFCEKEDNDTVSRTILTLSAHFPDISFEKVDDTIDDWCQMLTMSNCDHNIIANSSFSWWGGYFNKNPDKMVCYPSLWFGPAASNNDTRSMFPADWSKISVEKID
jgi:hypothetical protein